MRRYQKGMSFLGLVFMFVMIGVVGVIFMKMMPLYLNESKLKRAVTDVAHRPDVLANRGQMTTALQRWWDIDDFDFVTPSDITLSGGTRGGRALAYAYYARADLFADISVIVHFRNSIPASGGGAEN